MSLRRLLRRLSNALNPARAESDLAREVASHLALLEDEFRRRGMTVDEARVAAKRAFGGEAIAKDLHQPMEEIVEAAKVIYSFDPKPGRMYSDEDPHYITPDVYVYKVGDKYFVVPNDDGLPKLKDFPKELGGSGETIAE